MDDTKRTHDIPGWLQALMTYYMCRTRRFENSCEKDLKWENVSGVEDTDERRDLKHDKGSKEKEKTTRIRDPVVSQSNNNE